MADNKGVTPGTGATFATDEIGGVDYPRVKTTWGPDGTANDADVASGKPLPVQLRNSAGQLLSDTTGVLISNSQLPVAVATAQAMSAGFQLVGLPTDQPWPKGLSNRAISAAFSTITRPADTNPYAAADHIANSTTAGSVTAKSATVSDVNDDPLFLSEIHLSTTDTGCAGKKIRAYVFNADPTASSGVSGGDNAAYSQKVAGYVGSFMGWMETGFSDGTVGRLVPCFNETNFTQAGGFIPCLPVTGAKTLFIQLQAVEAFTPVSASVWTLRARGWQARAA